MKRFLALDQGLCFVLEDLALVFLEKKSSLISLSSDKWIEDNLFLTCLTLSRCHPLIICLNFIDQYFQSTLSRLWEYFPEAQFPDQYQWPHQKSRKVIRERSSNPKPSQIHPNLKSMLGFVSEQFYIGEDCEGLPVLWQHVRCSSDIILFFLLTKAVQGPWVGLGWTSGTGSQSVLGLHLHIRRDSSSHGHFWNLPLQL